MSDEVRDLFDRWERVWHEGQMVLVALCEYTPRWRAHKRVASALRDRTGKHLLGLNLTAFDPKRSMATVYRRSGDPVRANHWPAVSRKRDYMMIEILL